jgi:hypothetical protein
MGRSSDRSNLFNFRTQLFLVLVLSTIVDERALVIGVRTGVRTDHGLRYREAETRTKKFNFEVN